MATTSRLRGPASTLQGRGGRLDCARLAWECRPVQLRHADGRHGGGAGGTVNGGSGGAGVLFQTSGLVINDGMLAGGFGGNGENGGHGGVGACFGASGYIANIGVIAGGAGGYSAN